MVFWGVCLCLLAPHITVRVQVSSDLLFCPTSLLPIPSIWVPFVSSKGACVCVKERVWFVGLFTPPPQEKETHLALSYQFWDRQKRVSTRKKTDWGSLWWQKDLSCCTLIINTVSLVHKVQDLFVQNQNCTLPAQWRCALSFFQRLELEKNQRCDMQARYVVVIVLLWERLYFSTSSTLLVFHWQLL